MTNRSRLIDSRPISVRMLLFGFLAVSACTAEQTEAGRANPNAAAGIPTAAADVEAPYAFAEPDLSFALAADLEEISGLAVLPDGRIAAVQDEEGTIYVLNPETGAIDQRTPFGDPGDYEGIEWVDDRLFVLKSNGNLFELEGWSDGNLTVTEHRTGLRGRNDTEGLAYDAAGRRLLIACKEDPGVDLGDDVRAIYAFDLDSRSLAPDPVFTIDLNALKDVEGIGGRFKPSALAVHPRTGELYVLSANNRGLVVLATDGTLNHAWPLSDTRFEQPEGLAFLPDGTLFISSEGVDGPPMLYRFNQQ